MTITFDPPITYPGPSGISARRELCRIESVRYLRRASLWIGLAFTVLLAVEEARRDNRWSADKYQWLIPMVVGPLAFGTFVAALRTGNRDRSNGPPTLAPEAPLDAEDRVVARLVGLVIPVAMAVAVVTTVAIASRIEGGFWIGEGRGRTDTAVHSFLELLQPILIVAIVGAAGVAIGRAVQRTAPAMIAGAVGCFLVMAAWWIWNVPGLHAFALAQAQPLDVQLPAGTKPSDLPQDWLVSFPDEYAGWRRKIVHTPTIALHDVYLLGLAALCCGLAFRGLRRRRLVASGAAVAIIAAVAQLVVSPM